MRQTLLSIPSFTAELTGRGIPGNAVFKLSADCPTGITAMLNLFDEYDIQEKISIMDAEG